MGYSKTSNAPYFLHNISPSPYIFSAAFVVACCVCGTYASSTQALYAALAFGNCSPSVIVQYQLGSDAQVYAVISNLVTDSVFLKCNYTGVYFYTSYAPMSQNTSAPYCGITSTTDTCFSTLNVLSFSYVATNYYNNNNSK